MEKAVDLRRFVESFSKKQGEKMGTTGKTRLSQISPMKHHYGLFQKKNKKGEAQRNKKNQEEGGKNRPSF